MIPQRYFTTMQRDVRNIYHLICRQFTSRDRNSCRTPMLPGVIKCMHSTHPLMFANRCVVFTDSLPCHVPLFLRVSCRFKVGCMAKIQDLSRSEDTLVISKSCKRFVFLNVHYIMRMSLFC